MPFVRFAVALCAIATIICGRAQAAEPQQADIVWGANGHPLISYPGVPIENQLDALRDLGMRSYRVDITDTTYIAELRDIVRKARARGITILPVVTPQFDLAQESVEGLEKKAYGLAFALVSSFKGQIPVWELGNEMENYAIIQPCEMQDDGKQYPCSYGPAGGVTSLEYYGPRWQKVSAVLKGLSRGAHDADPSVRRALGTAGWGHLGAFDRMKADGIEWDISVWHMYGEDPEWAFKKLKEFKKPIWVTEFNHPKGSVGGKEEQAKGLVRSMSLLIDLQETYGVEAAHVYELLDEPYWDDYEAHMGLIELKKAGDDKWALAAAKPAYAAVKERIADSATGPQEIVVLRNCELPYGPQAAALPAPTIVAYAFCLALGRDPDGAGSDAWSAELALGKPIEQILTAMLLSDEFTRRQNADALPNHEYVGLMHRLLLGTLSEKAMARDLSELDGGGSRAAFLEKVLASEAFRLRHSALFAKLGPARPRIVASSAEVPKVHRSCDMGAMNRPLQFERGQVIYSYCLVLGRWPDGIGLASWSRERRNGLTLEKFLVALLNSYEFSQRYKIGTLGNTQFVTLVYRLLLNRDPDAGGLDEYVTLLDSGKMSRADIYAAIVASDEFRNVQPALFTAQMPSRKRAQLEDKRPATSPDP